MNTKIVDHLFRHQYGKMVAILTNFFGLSHIETIEDAVQDTFIKATLLWRTKTPENPEAWLIQVAKNRMIDLLRKIKADNLRYDKIATGAASIQLNELFLEHEVEDNQLRMIFVACHPSLKPNEQIAFALKTISGFSTKEIAAALLIKEETIKKRLARARKTIISKNIQFNFPSRHKINARLERVLEVIYLTFNEGFHSTKKSQLINKDLCGEAIRLCKLLLKKEQFRSSSMYALFALMCFHTARLESKINANNEIVDLEHQDRTKWYKPLIQLGNNAMYKSLEYNEISRYFYEASIASEHIKAKTFATTNWKKILYWYEQLNTIYPSASSLLNTAIVKIQLEEYKGAFNILEKIPLNNLEQRSYLLYGCYAKYYEKMGNINRAIDYLDKSLAIVTNNLEKEHLIKKRELLKTT